MPIEISKLIEALKAKDIPYELYGENSKITWFDNTPLDMGQEYGLMLGVSMTENIWCWWEVWDGHENGEYNRYYFKQKYSQNTGKSIKSYRTGFKVQQKLEKLLKIKNLM